MINYTYKWKGTDLIKKDGWKLALLSSITFLVYLNSVTGEFVFDDWMLIRDNTLIHHLANWKTILNYSYRPVRTLVLAVLYHFFEMDPVGYHIINISIHIVLTTMVFFLCRRLVGNSTVALFASLIFGTHPIQTDAVSYISGLRDTLSSLLYVTSFYCFVHYRDKGEPRWVAASLALYVLAGFTKEMAVSLVFMFFTYDYVMRVDTALHLTISQSIRSSWRAGKQILLEYRWFYIGLFMFFLLMTYYYVIMRHASGRIGSENIAWYGGSIFLNYLTIPKIILYYLKQLIFPMNLIADYKYYPLVAKSVAEPQALFALTFVIEMILSIFIVLRYNRIMAFSLLWIIITLLPALNILPHHEFMAEHYLYLPMVGFAIYLALCFHLAINRSESRVSAVVFLCLFGLLIGLYSVRTVMRNEDWQSDLTLTATQLKINPKSTRALSELGYLYSEMNLLQSAEQSLNRALDITPGYANALNNLGIVYSKRREFEKAAETFQAAVLQRESRPAQANLGITQMILKQKDEGRASFLKALEQDPINENALISMYYVHFFEGEFDKAAEYIRRNIRYRPDSIDSYFLLADVFLKTLQFKEAAAIFEVILEVKPENEKAIKLLEETRRSQEKWDKIQKIKQIGNTLPEKFMLLSELYISIAEFKKARKQLEEGLKDHNQNSELLKLYGDVLLKLGEFEKAIPIFQDIVRNQPNDIEGHFLLAKLYTLDLKFNEAMREVDIITGLDPDHKSLPNLRTSLEENYEKYKKIQKLKLKDPEQAQIKFLTGEIYESFGLTDKSVELYRALLNEPAYSISVRYKLGTLYLRKNEVSAVTEALKAYRDIIEMKPDETEAYNRLGRINMNLIKDFETARDHFQKSLEIDPNQPDAKRLDEILKALGEYIQAVKVEKKYLLPYMNDDDFIRKFMLEKRTVTDKSEDEVLLKRTIPNIEKPDD